MAAAQPKPGPEFRPILKPGLRRLWRDPHTVQFGADPDTAVVVPDVDDRVAEFLLTLDGRWTRSQAVAASGLPDDTAAALLDHLVSAGVVDDAAAVSAPFGRALKARRERLGPELASLTLAHTDPGAGSRAFLARRRTRVRVEGLGRLGAALTLLLDACGFDQLDLLDGEAVREVDVLAGGHRGSDVDQPRDRALSERLSHPPARKSERPPTHPPALVVLAALPDVRVRARSLVNAGQPHLVVDVVEGVGRLGPLVVPGQTACLTCTDHHRTDRDPAWPRLMAQLSGPQPTVAPAVVVAATAAMAAFHITCWSDGGRPPSVDAELSVRPPDGLVRQHDYPPHPSCGCNWQQQAQSQV